MTKRIYHILGLPEETPVAMDEAIAEAGLMERESKAFRELVARKATTLWDGDYCLRITLENVEAAMKEK